jgi:hypothetical protein
VACALLGRALILGWALVRWQACARICDDEPSDGEKQRDGEEPRGAAAQAQTDDTDKRADRDAANEQN